MAPRSGHFGLGGAGVKDAVEDLRFEQAQSKTVGQRVRGEDIPGGLLGLFGHMPQHTAVPGPGAVRLAALRAIPFEAVDHLIETNLLWASGQFMAAVWPARRRDEAGASEDHQDLAEERPGECLPPPHLATP